MYDMQPRPQNILVPATSVHVTTGEPILEKEKTPPLHKTRRRSFVVSRLAAKRKYGRK